MSFQATLSCAITATRLLLQMLDSGRPVVQSTSSSATKPKYDSKRLEAVVIASSREADKKARRAGAIMGDLNKSAAENDATASRRRIEEASKRSMHMYVSPETKTSLCVFLDEALKDMAALRSLPELDLPKQGGVPVFTNPQTGNMFRLALERQLEALIYIQKTWNDNLHHLVGQSFEATACLDAATHGTSDPKEAVAPQRESIPPMQIPPLFVNSNMDDD